MHNNQTHEETDFGGISECDNVIIMPSRDASISCDVIAHPSV